MTRFMHKTGEKSSGKVCDELEGDLLSRFVFWFSRNEASGTLAEATSAFLIRFRRALTSGIIEAERREADVVSKGVVNSLRSCFAGNSSSKF